MFFLIGGLNNHISLLKDISLESFNHLLLLIFLMNLSYPQFILHRIFGRRRVRRPRAHPRQDRSPRTQDQTEGRRRGRKRVTGF